VDEALARLTSPAEIAIPASGLITGSPWKFNLTLPQKRYILIMDFADFNADRQPYLTVAANNQVIWDNYLSRPAIQIVLPVTPGKNSLEIASLNGSITIARAACIAEDENSLELKR